MVSRRRNVARRFITSVKRDGSQILVAGNGPSIDVVCGGEFTTSSSINVFDDDGSHVTGVVDLDDGGLLVYGEKNVCILDKIQGDVDRTGSVIRFSDTILSVANVRYGNCEAVVLSFTLNRIVLLLRDQLQSRQPEYQCSIQCEHTVVLMSNVLSGETWSDLLSIVGTVMGEVLVWRPSQGPQVLRTYSGHDGMVFSMCLHGSFLFSVSDDRSLRVWKWDRNVSGADDVRKHIACAYGHSARPFGVCHLDGRVYTGGVDQMICEWLWNACESTLVVLRTFALGVGTIRSMYVGRNPDSGQIVVYAGGDMGGLSLLYLPEEDTSKLRLLEFETNDLRGFSIVGDQIVTTDNLGVLRRGEESVRETKGKVLRYLVGGQSRRDTAVAYGDKQLCILSSDGSNYCSEVKAKILSCVTDGRFVFVYTVDKIGQLFDELGKELCGFSLCEALEQMQKTKSLIPSACCWISSRIDENSHMSMLIVGSSTGQMFTSVPDMHANSVSVMKSCSKVNKHFGGDYVMDIYRDSFGVVHTVGKNGLWCKWTLDYGNIDEPLQLLERSSVSCSVDMDSPSAFHAINQRFFVVGFQSNEFRVIDATSGLCVGSVDCGGGNRPWAIEWKIGESSSSFRLCFIKDKKLMCVEKPLIVVKELSPNIHKTQIVFTRRLLAVNDITVIATGSNDNTMCISMVDNIGSLCLLRRFFDASSFVSVDSVETNDGAMIVTGGCKGRILLWKVYRNVTSASDDFRTVQRMIEFNHSESTRVVSVSIFPKGLEHWVAASHGSGNIDCYSVDEGNGRLLLQYTIPQPDLSLCSKLRGFCRTSSVVEILTASTSGTLSLYSAGEQNMNLKWKTEAEHCGLSALGCCEKDESERWIVTGSESGRLTVFSSRGGSISRRAEMEYHASTVTDVKCSLREDLLLIRSVALDSRLVDHQLNIKTGQVFRLRSLPLGVWDPSSLESWEQEPREQICVMGAGSEFILSG